MRRCYDHDGISSASLTTDRAAEELRPPLLSEFQTQGSKTVKAQLDEFLGAAWMKRLLGQAGEDARRRGNIYILLLLGASPSFRISLALRGWINASSANKKGWMDRCTGGPEPGTCRPTDRSKTILLRIEMQLQTSLAVPWRFFFGAVGAPRCSWTSCP